VAVSNVRFLFAYDNSGRSCRDCQAASARVAYREAHRKKRQAFDTASGIPRRACALRFDIYTLSAYTWVYTLKAYHSRNGIRRSPGVYSIRLRLSR
jgi:hypothetical protein